MLLSLLKLSKLELKSHLKKQTETDPLIVLVMFLFEQVTVGVADAGVGDGDARLLIEVVLDGVGGVNPAVGVEHILGDVLGVYAIDRIANVLPSGYD